MSKENVDKKRLKKKFFISFFSAILIVGSIFFLTAGSFAYWQAWIVMGILFIPTLFISNYFLKHDPELLERRMRYKEKENEQKILINIATLLFLIGFCIPGFDFRYGRSNVPIYIVVLSYILMVLGYLLVFFVFRENTYTSRIIEVEKGQKVITTGPYSMIRHPMYVGVILMYIFMPMALGSYIATLFFIPIIGIIIFRILNEEKVLLKELPGYQEYCRKVKYRLLPGIW